MMIAESVIAKLVCPETKQSLRALNQSELDALNQKIASGSIMTVEGSPESIAIEQGLIRSDGKAVFPIRDGIPVMLIEKALRI